MGYQFIHEECYARVAAAGKLGGHSVRSILAEAHREPAACPHVDAPQPPVLLYGVPLDQVERRAEEYAQTVRDARGRALRKDSPLLLAGVVSCPSGLSDDEWRRLYEDSVAALRERYSDRLLSVVEHIDEARRHLHYYCVPLDGERFDMLHTGRGAKARAEAKARDAGATKSVSSKAGNDAYKCDRRQFQQWYFERVGLRHGLTRLGPGRRRLTREAWRAEQTQAEAVRLAKHREAEALEQAQRALAVHDEIEQRAQRVLDREVTLHARNKDLAKRERELAASRARWERTGERVGAVIGAVREAVVGPVRRLRESIDQLQREHRDAVKRARIEGRKAARAESERELREIATERDRHREDARCLRRQLGMPSDDMSPSVSRHVMAAPKKSLHSV